jgi:L-amino acid N-acyltransferase YncA
MRMSNKEGTATAEVDSLPGCSQIAVIHSAFVVPEARRNRVGHEAHEERLERLRGEFNYDAAIATVALSNEPELKILRRAGWKQVGQFFSRKTERHVGVFFRTLVREDLPAINKTYDDYVEEMERS